MCMEEALRYTQNPTRDFDQVEPLPFRHPAKAGVQRWIPAFERVKESLHGHSDPILRQRPADAGRAQDEVCMPVTIFPLPSGERIKVRGSRRNLASAERTRRAPLTLPKL